MWVVIMRIRTKFIGELDIKEEEIIEFTKGLPAFETETQFVIVPFDEGTPFFILQSIKQEDVAFIIVNPFAFYSDYQVKLPDSLIEGLEIEKESEVAIFSIVTVQEPFTESTANLQAPVIINLKKKKGKQLVMPDSGYYTKHKLFMEQTSRVGEGK